MILGIMLLILLFVLSARTGADKGNGIWHCYKDIYLRDISGILILGILCVILCGTHTYAAESVPETADASTVLPATDRGAEPIPAPASAPKVTIYDQDGIPVLYKGQYTVKDGDDIRLYIPNDSLSSGRIPTRIEVID